MNFNASIKKGKMDTRSSRKILYVLLLFVVASVLLWLFNEVVQWQWLATHPNRIVIYTAVQVSLLLIALLLLSPGEKAKAIELRALLVSIASMIIPLLIGTHEKPQNKPIPIYPTPDITAKTPRPDPVIKTPARSPVKKVLASKQTDGRIIFLSGTIVDAANGMPLDSVAIMINYFIVGYSDRFGVFNIQYLQDRCTETTMLQFQKQGYEKTMETTLTPVKDANIELTGKKIELVKV